MIFIFKSLHLKVKTANSSEYFSVLWEKKVAYLHLYLFRTHYEFTPNNVFISVYIPNKYYIDNVT